MTEGLPLSGDRRRGARAALSARVSGSPALSDVVRRVRRVQRRGGPVPGLGVPPGRLAPPGCADAPVVLLLALGLGREELAGWAGLVARAQAAGHRFRPVWVLDSGDFPALLAHGWAFDHVVAAQEHARLGGSQAYPQHLAERLALWQSRTAAPVVPLLGPPPSGGEAGTRLGVVLGAVTGTGGPGGLSARARAAAAGRRRSRS